VKCFYVPGLSIRNAETIHVMSDGFLVHLHGCSRYLPSRLSHVQLSDKPEGYCEDKCRSFARRKEKYRDRHSGIRGGMICLAGQFSHFMLGHANLIVGSLLGRWHFLLCRFIGSDGS